MLVNNPEIVSDDLVLCLDTGASTSYPGSGTDWFDLTGNDLLKKKFYFTESLIKFPGH